MSKIPLLAVPFILTVLCAPSYQAPVESALDGLGYLEHYGYLPPMDLKAGQLRTGEELEEGIKRFQRMANITVTGEMDDKTMEMMNRPRCGMPDMMGTMDEGRRQRRYSAGPVAWPKNDLTYRITRYTADLSQQQIDDIMKRAFDVWSAETPLTFTQIFQGTPDIVIFFARQNHGDGGPFDGPGGVLAHAYFPTNGDAHFDDDELYTEGTSSGINLFQVAAHEFGHSLGLGHSEVPDALMAPFYQGYVPNFQLNEDDVLGIQYLYGMPDSREVTQPPNPNPDPNPNPGCSGVFDAITRTQDGSTYAFRGSLFWKMTSDVSSFGDSQSISAEWPGLPNDIDTALFWQRNSRTYFFKGDQYWRYYNQNLDAGYPKPISVWRGLPSNIDAAFVWGGNGRTYFIKGDQYYRYTSGSGVDQGYPRPLSVWGNLPGSIDAAFQWRNGRTYFFSGNQYYRYNDGTFDVDVPQNAPSYPRNTAMWWMGCSDGNLVQETTTVDTDSQRSNCDGDIMTGNGNNILPNVTILFLVFCIKIIFL
ncbi:matrix metalloproteinase-14-like [Ptychodera flava]|uniref:matrix metalloproteinase-14-like n=1 Tax=Ptychodera flava TaxID=63121 RepID=UPI00396A1E6C